MLLQVSSLSTITISGEAVAGIIKPTQAGVLLAIILHMVTGTQIHVIVLAILVDLFLTHN